MNKRTGLHEKWRTGEEEKKRENIRWGYMKEGEWGTRRRKERKKYEVKNINAEKRERQERRGSQWHTFVYSGDQQETKNNEKLNQLLKQ